MANPGRKKPRNVRRGRPARPLFPDLAQVLPSRCCQSLAWKHFRNAQVEFLSGVQVLGHDCLEWMKLSERPGREVSKS